MDPITEINTFLSLKNDKGRIENKFLGIISGSGFGKTMFEEAIVEKFHKAGYLIIWIADPKRQIEGAFAMFEPEEKYHLDLLRIQGTMPGKKNVKIYHPFTFNIPRTYLPDINFFTFSIKNITRREISFLTESFYDSDVSKLLLSAVQNISKEDGIFSLLHYLQDEIKGKKTGRHLVADPKNFYLSATMGTLKSLQDISNNFQLFKRDFFLAKDNCPINLDLKKILQDRENYHIFTTKWIGDEKLESFCVLTLLNQIIKNSDYAKYPILLVIPEIRKLCPLKPEGYKTILADMIKESLSLMRSIGKGMSAIMDSQVFEDIDEDVVDSFTRMFIGQLGGARDLERVCKALGYGKDIRNQLKRMEKRNSYFLVGYENMGTFTGFVPSHMHKEENYSFFEMYHKYYSDKMKRYDDVTEMMQKIYDNEEEKIRERVKRRQKELREEAEKKKEEREENKVRKTDELKDKIQKINKDKMNLKKDEFRRWIIEHPEASLREIEKSLGISRMTAKRWKEELKTEEENKINQES